MISSTRWPKTSALTCVGTLLSLTSLVDAYTFNIDNTPTQCQNLSISISGSGGTPPYRALIVPFGQTPLANNVEARTIVDQAFDGDSTSVSFELKYPALSQFVLVVSDSANFGSGGTSSAATVVSSSDSSCFNSTQSVQSDFVFNTDPLNQIVQCTSSRLWWDPDDVEGNVRFYGIIPGGDSFNITVSDTTQETNEGTGFNWVPSIRGGTTLLLGAGDDRGLGAGGSVTYIVSQSSNTSCLNSDSPSSTAGSPAGGSYPTSTAEAEGGGNSSSSSSDAGAIAGGVVGGVVAICAFILVLVFLRRRKRKAARSKERTDLFTDNEQPGSGREAEMEHLAPPEPYMVLPSDAAQPSSSSDHGGASSSGAPESSYGYGIGTGAGGGAARYGDRRQSQRSLLASTEAGEHAYGRPGTPGTSAGTSMATNTRKSAAPPVLRPVNIIQHEDAGAPSEADEQAGDAETVELPPAYTNIRNG